MILYTNCAQFLLQWVHGIELWRTRQQLGRNTICVFLSTRANADLPVFQFVELLITVAETAVLNKPQSFQDNRLQFALSSWFSTKKGPRNNIQKMTRDHGRQDIKAKMSIEWLEELETSIGNIEAKVASFCNRRFSDIDGHRLKFQNHFCTKIRWRSLRQCSEISLFISLYMSMMLHLNPEEGKCWSILEIDWSNLTSMCIWCGVSLLKRSKYWLKI